MTPETRTFIGESATSIGDGYAGFRIGRTYKLQAEHHGDTVAIVLDHHVHVNLGARPLVGEQWF